MKLNICLLAAICLLFAGCGQSDQTKSEDSQKQSKSGVAEKGQADAGPDAGNGDAGPGGLRDRVGTAGGGSFDPTAGFKASDTDGDGKLTGEEISGRVKDDLAAIDIDNDGAITLEEHQDWFRKRAAKGVFGGPDEFGGSPEKIGGGGDFRAPGPGKDQAKSEEPKDGTQPPKNDE